jgi:hypothetical protein
MVVVGGGQYLPIPNAHYCTECTQIYTQITSQWESSSEPEGICR